MKRILCAALAVTLLSTSAASARDWDHHGWHGGRGVGAAVALGLGILTLGILAAESAHAHDRYRDRYYDGDRSYDGDGYYGRDGGRDRYGDADRDGNRGYDNRHYDNRDNGENNPDADQGYDGGR
ncbi:MAG TPA: hypothetical protein VMJ73_05395 [Rhizomicrobium sp.]|nr:hypothetical protein [Rhizomicrobium sp.]